MRHRKNGRPLGRNRSHRRALFRNLVTSLLRHERIETTEAKGKEIRAISDKMITLGLQGDLASRRQAAAYLQDPKVVARLFSDLAPLYKTQPEGKEGGKPTEKKRGGGGYTRLIKTRVRYGDGAPLVIVELTKRTASTSTPDKADKAKTSPETVEKPIEKVAAS